MEKKTMGSFIAALRRAKGMTQRELAERLNVSDKTVSRWERDEGYPDLSLIPVIAEIFGVTSDELLRGQRSSTKTSSDEEVQDSAPKKGAKELKMLQSKMVASFRSRSILAMGISALGVIVAAVCNTGFNRGPLGFFIGLVFFIASVVIEAVAINASLSKDYEDVDDGRLRNTTIRFSELTFGAILVMLMFCLPLAVMVPDTYMGLTGGSWLAYGGLFSLIALFICFVVVHVLNASLVRKGTLVLSFEEKDRFFKVHRLNSRFCLVVLLVVLVTAIIHYRALDTSDLSNYMRGRTFNDIESFVAYMEQDIPDPNIGDVTYYNYGEYGDVITEEQNFTQSLYDSEGNETVTFVLRNRDVATWTYNTVGGSVLPITVYTYEDRNEGTFVLARRNMMFVSIYIIEALLLAFAYYILRKRID